MKLTIIIMVMLFSLCGYAQVSSVNLQASGLTCSMCSNAINKALKTLDFVSTVAPNIKNSTFDISFKPGIRVDLDLLKAKVEGAGFSVARLTATMHFDHVAVANDEHVVIDGTAFHFLNVSNQVINGDKTLRVLDKGFVTAKEYKKNSAYTKMECYKTGVAGGKRIFHVTI